MLWKNTLQQDGKPSNQQQFNKHGGNQAFVHSIQTFSYHQTFHQATLLPPYYIHLRHSQQGMPHVLDASSDDSMFDPSLITVDSLSGNSSGSDTDYHGSESESESNSSDSENSVNEDAEEMLHAPSGKTEMLFFALFTKKCKICKNMQFRTNNSNIPQWNR